MFLLIHNNILYIIKSGCISIITFAIILTTARAKIYTLNSAVSYHSKGKGLMSMDVVLVYDLLPKMTERK